MHFVAVPHASLVTVRVVPVVVVVDIAVKDVSVHIRRLEHVGVAQILAEPTDLGQCSENEKTQTKTREKRGRHPCDGESVRLNASLCLVAGAVRGVIPLANGAHRQSVVCGG